MPWLTTMVSKTSLGPQRPDLRRQEVLYAFDLAHRHVPGQDPEDGPGHLLRADVTVAPERRADLGEELLQLALLDGLAGRLPALVVDPADQERELGPQGGDLPHGQVVAQRVEDRPQRVVGPVPILPAHLLHQLIEPDV